MFDEIVKFMNKPALFTRGTDNFWNNEHISKSLLESHLNPSMDAASRNTSFLDQSADWMSKRVPPNQKKKLLDLGCGPGLYTERFANLGYIVTGIDFSERSIAYAKEQARINNSKIDYHYQNYLTIGYHNEFDIVTLIYCDYGALSTADRRTILDKIYQALKPGGKIILDVFTTNLYKSRNESRTWKYCEKGGFWSKKPHICLDSVYHYDEDNTELRQSIVQTKETLNCYNVWEHFFTRESLLSEMQAAGFDVYGIYGDAAGKDFSDTGDTICGIFTK